MKLRPQSNFTANGVLKGTIIAFDDKDDPLGWECYGNWSVQTFRDKAAKGLAEAADVTHDKARALIALAIREARRAAEAVPESNEVDQEIRITTRQLGLIDLVNIAPAGQPIQPAFLFIGEHGLQAVERHLADGVCYVPPTGDSLFPILPLPRYSEVVRYYTSDTEIQIFQELQRWHKRASNLGEGWRYQLIALWDFHTWLADQLSYSPYLVFQSKDGERGKSRQGRSIAWVSYRGFTTETLQEANLFRWSDAFGLTLFFDVFDLWKKAEKRGCEDLILGRFDRFGPKVARVLDPAAGAFKDTKYFDVYGPTIIATNETPHDLVLSRGIVIVPPEASGRYDNFTPSDALPLKERLCAFRARHLKEGLPLTDKPASGRLGDILQPLAQVAKLLGSETQKAFDVIVAELEKDRKQRASETPEGHLIEHVIRCVESKQLEENLLSMTVLASFFNEKLSERSQISHETLGRRMTALGFKPGRMTDGSRGRIVDVSLLSSLAKKYGIKISENGVLQELSKLSNCQNPIYPLSDSSVDSSGEPSDTQVQTDGENRQITVQLQPKAKIDSCTVLTVPSNAPEKQKNDPDYTLSGARLHKVVKED